MKPQTTIWSLKVLKPYRYFPITLWWNIKSFPLMMFSDNFLIQICVVIKNTWFCRSSRFLENIILRPAIFSFQNENVNLTYDAKLFISTDTVKWTRTLLYLNKRPYIKYVVRRPEVFVGTMKNRKHILMGHEIFSYVLL